MSNIPIVLICGCKKYELSLRNAIERLIDPEWKVLGIMGNETAKEPTFDGKIVTLPVHDSYEYLPEKIVSAMEWCSTQWPEAVGIFKTDDDIVFHDKQELKDTIFRNLSTPYWGTKLYTTNPSLPIPERLTHTNLHAIDYELCVLEQIVANYSDKQLKLPKLEAIFCGGPGYWVSKDMISIVSRKDATYGMYTIGPEDTYIGYRMNQCGIYPFELRVQYTVTRCNYNDTVRRKVLEHQRKQERIRQRKQARCETRTGLSANQT